MVRELLHPLDRKLLRELWRLRGQALAIAAVIGAGVAVLVMMSGMLASLDATRAAYYDRYRFADIWAPVKRAPETLKADLSRIPGVAAVETRIFVDVTLDVAGMAEPATGRMISLPEAGRPAINDLVLRAGRWPEPGHPREVLASEGFAAAHGIAPGGHVAAIINGRKRDLIVTGTALSPEFVYAIAPGQLMPDEKRFGVLWMGRKPLAAAYDLDGAFNEAVLRLMHGAVPEDVIERADALLDRHGGVGAYGREDQISDEFLRSEMDQLGNFGTVLPPIFLAVAAFLLNVVITRMIETEREQIGLLKAFGYSNAAVGGHYLKFVGVLTGLGIILGMGAGAWLGRGIAGMYTEFFNFPFLDYRLTPAVFAIGALASLAAAAAGTILAVRRAALLPPAVAMRPRPPTRYAPTWIERLVPRNHADQPTRMILRHIGRWPMRAGLTVTGMSFAMALLIASSFSLDAIEYLIDVTFFQAERQHMTLTLEEPHTLDALRAVERLPGVMAAQPFRTVAAKLRHGPRVERIGITGVVPEPSISRVLDARNRPVAIPESGLLLGSHLANKLGARPGDTILVEVMEGRRPTRAVPVAAVVEGYIGMAAYMNIRDLNRTMREGRVVSGAHVLRDAVLEAELYTQVKATPALAGVQLQTKALENFRRTIAEHITLTIVVNVIFAALIAVGVVYNSARISLSERARELASLRVLGFTRFEVGYILLGELALLTLAALPLGMLLGFGLAHWLGELLATDLYRIPVVIDRDTYGTAVLVVVVSSVVSGLIVARRIAGLDLVAVLKTRD